MPLSSFHHLEKQETGWVVRGGASARVHSLNTFLLSCYWTITSRESCAATPRKCKSPTTRGKNSPHGHQVLHRLPFRREVHHDAASADLLAIHCAPWDSCTESNCRGIVFASKRPHEIRQQERFPINLHGLPTTRAGDLHLGA